MYVSELPHVLDLCLGDAETVLCKGPAMGVVKSPVVMMWGGVIAMLMGFISVGNS